MAIKTSANIRRSTVGQWRTRDAINASDYAGIIEVSHTLFSRIGATVPGWWGDWRTTSTTFTAATTTSDPNLDEWLGASRLTRTMSSASGDTLVFRFSAILADCEAQLTVTRVDSDGTETVVENVTVSETGTSLTQQTISAELTFAETREGGVSGGDAAVIQYELLFKHLGAGAEAQLQAWHVDEWNDGSTESVIPGDEARTVITSWSALPSSPSDGDQVLYEDSGGARVTVEYDGTNSWWEMTDTGGAWVTIEDFSGGAIDTDLWAVTDTDSRFTQTGGALQFSVSASTTAQANINASVRLSIGGVLRITGGLNGLGQPSSGANGFRLIVEDFDQDSDDRPLAASKYRYDSGQNPRIEQVNYEELGTSNFENIATGLNSSSTYTWSVGLSDDGLNTSSAHEAFDSSNTTLGTGTYTYPNSYDSNAVNLSVLFIDDQTDVSGTMSVSEIQVRIS